MGDTVAKAALFDQLARVGKALGNGKRLELLDLLAQGEYSVEALAQEAGLGLTTVSAHLQALKNAGLVTTRRDGTRIHYRLAGGDVAELYAKARDVAAARMAAVEQAARAYLGDTPRQVTRDELLSGLKTGQYTVLDVRPAGEYAAGHIPGALSIPVEELELRLAEIPADTHVVAYCRGAYCVFAHDAVRMLTDAGYDASRLEDGLLEWRIADLPLEASRP
jgi:rhodanese-related sulfurtransferase/DNA-binding transcriptional ArsR family regulator